jgi:hypothetical protein
LALCLPEAGDLLLLFLKHCKHLMKYVYVEFGMLHLEVSLVVAFVFQGRAAGAIVSFAPIILEALEEDGIPIVLALSR